jgi:hypothetical protein
MRMDKMTDEQIRVEIAKVKGWKFYESTPTPDNTGVNVPWERRYLELFSPEFQPDNPFWNFREVVDWPEKWRQYAVVVCPKPWPSDIAAAWELVDEMNASGDGLISLVYRTGDDLDNFGAFHWAVEFRLLSSAAIKRQADYITAYADTPARAISLAYLAWKGVEG